ncbi:MAG TPA: hypothetical protein VMG12_18990 [Polyangiaceae bacterium]|nr:hypothetical protein [Polyangiaceae bacterium]
MSELTTSHARHAIVHTLRGLTLFALAGAGACGAEKTSDPAPASTESEEARIEGQSGTEYEPGGDHPACPCGWLHNPLRATVLEVVPHIEGTDFFPIRMGKVRLRVEELLGNTTGVEIGSEISGGWFGNLPCFYGCASVDVGDEVLAFYRPEYPCTGSCPNGDTIEAGITGIVPWDETMVLAEFVNGDITITPDELPLLESPECGARLGNIGDLLGPNDVEERCYEVAPRNP